MRLPTLLKNYRRLSDNNLSFRAEVISLSLTDNLNFPLTVPTLTDFNLKKAAFATAMQSISTGDRLSIAIKNEARAELLSTMKQLALNIESLAPGDRAKLLSSGFELGSDGENVPAIDVPKNFKISDGINSGELILSVRGEAQAVSYMHEYTEDPVTPESRWESKVSTSSKHTFTGLRPGIRIHGRVAIIGRKGQEAYSYTLTRIVQ